MVAFNCKTSQQCDTGREAWKYTQNPHTSSIKTSTALLELSELKDMEGLKRELDDGEVG